METSEVTCVGIIGAGTMGSQISAFCLACGKEVFLYDAVPAALERAVQHNKERFSEHVNKGELASSQAEERLARLHPCSTLEACVATAGIILEMVPERPDLKRQVFAELDLLAPAQTIIASNSSCIPSSRMAEATARADRILGMNFSPPKLVELMGNAQTSLATLALAERFVRSIGMMPIVTRREIMGYSFNRTWRAIKREALHLADGGYIDPEDYDRAWMLEFGTPYGPFGLMDRVGLDVVRDIEALYYQDSKDERDKPPKLLDDMIAEGRLGVKSGRGFFSYPNPAYEQPGWLWKKLPQSASASID